MKKVEKNLKSIDPNPGEIVISKNHLLEKKGFTILYTEAYAMPSSTYVPDDSHVFTVTFDKTSCWKNFGRCWNSEGDRVRIASQKAYKEWLFEFCPPNFYERCGIIFGINGVCHTAANRELLIGEDDVDVRKAPKNFVTVSIFGKYGFGLDTLKQLITEAYNRAILKVDVEENLLDKVLARIDNTLDDETMAWQQLIEFYVQIPLGQIINNHPEAKDALQKMVSTLMTEREKIYGQYSNRIFKKEEYEKHMYILFTKSLSDYIDFLALSKYIDTKMENDAKKNMMDFFNKLFKVVDEQIQAVNQTGTLDQEMAKKQ